MMLKKCYLASSTGKAVAFLILGKPGIGFLGGGAGEPFFGLQRMVPPQKYVLI